MEEFDFLVIGSGSGLDVANAAAKQGQSVVVVEKGRLGGTCLNRGCIPSKMLLYHADVRETVERADEFGIDAEVKDVAFSDIVEEVNDEVRESSESIREGLRSSSRHELYEGEATFVGDRTVEVSGYDDEIRGETVLIAAGARPAVPPVEGIESVDYITSKEALRLEEPPDRLVIVGGGYIAAELGQFFGAFGSQVSIVGRRPHLLPDADPETADEFTKRYTEKFDVYTGYEATSVEETGRGIEVEATLFNPSDDERDETVAVEGDELLVAAGRRPNTDTLNLEATGVETDEDGFVSTDDYLRTTADGVWALGDIVGEYLLKHNANHEAQAVARNLFSDELEPVDYTAMPFAVFGSPEVAGVGATEDDLVERGDEYATRTYRYEDTGRGKAMKAEGFVKAIVDLEGEILGCHIVGPDASTLIQEVVVAMKAGSGTVSDIRESVHIHPALTEVVQRAFSGSFSRGGGAGHDHEHDHG